MNELLEQKNEVENSIAIAKRFILTVDSLRVIDSESVIIIDAGLMHEMLIKQLIVFENKLIEVNYKIDNFQRLKKQREDDKYFDDLELGL